MVLFKKGAKKAEPIPQSISIIPEDFPETKKGPAEKKEDFSEFDELEEENKEEKEQESSEEVEQPSEEDLEIQKLKKQIENIEKKGIMKKQPKEVPVPVPEEKKEEPVYEKDETDLGKQVIAAIQNHAANLNNHEQRIRNIEAALFRSGGI
jgi:hypothetical protein